MPTTLDTFILSISIAYAVWFLAVQRRSGRPPLPPGPRGWPLIGNLLEMPQSHEWFKYTEWGKKYGDLVTVSVPGQRIVILNSAKEAMEILDKKSRIYSNRPPFHMGDIIGWQNSIAFIQYGPTFQSRRKIFHQSIGTNAGVKRFYPATEAEVYRFLNLLFTKPDFFDHIKRLAGTLIIRIVFGYEPNRSGKDPLISIADTVTDEVGLATSTGGFLVNYVPLLKHVPEWVPGAGFQRIAREMRKNLDEMLDRPYNFVRQEMAKGTAQPSVLYGLMKDRTDLSEDDIYNIKWMGEDFYLAGSDTTVSTIHSFFKAMVLYPEIQKRAQAEIDEVIGNDRLPTMADRDSLPYVFATVLEAMRWHIVLPAGVTHRATEDDVHNGYLIPKGTNIIANIWFMARDPRVYKDPHLFNPARFLKTEDHEPEPDPRGIVFGFGRRICPGRLLADTSIFTACAMVLAACNITPHMENGVPVLPDLEHGGGVVSHPSLFDCTIKPRSEKVTEFVQAQLARED